MPVKRALAPKKTGLMLDVSVQTDLATGNVQAVYFLIRQGQSAKIKEFAGGNAFADYDRKGNLLGVEILAPCNIAVFDKIASGEPKPIRSFLRNSIPREMALV